MMALRVFRRRISSSSSSILLFFLSCVLFSSSLLVLTATVVEGQGGQPAGPLPTIQPFSLLAGVIPGDTNGAAKSKISVSDIPNFALYPTHETVADGFWSSPATWNGSAVPGTGSRVLIKHLVGYDIAPATNLPLLNRVSIQAGAVLAFRVDMNTEMRVGTLYVAEDGTLFVGSVAVPLPGTFSASIKFTDEAVNANGEDPFEWGHGLLILGEAEFFSGDIPHPYLRAAGEFSAGQTSFSAHVPPSLATTNPTAGWRANDRLMVPDTRQLSLNVRILRGYDRTLTFGDVDHQLAVSSITPAANNRVDISLASPGFVHGHPGMKNISGGWDLDAEGVHRFTPVVANMRRNIMISSMNPGDYTTGNVATRGHVTVIGTGRAAFFGVHFLDLGRTKLMQVPAGGANSPNQIGRYALHFHHAIGKPRDPYIQAVFGCVLEKNAKWGLAIHNTHFSAFSWNIVFVSGGAGIILEDGNEKDNLIDSNLVVGVYGTGIRASDAAKGGVGIGIATEGTGVWLHGIFSNIVNNIASTIWTRVPSDGGPYTGIDNGEFGFGFSVFNTHAQGSNLGYDMPVPTVPGSRDPSTWTIQNPVKTPIRFDNNEFMGCGWGGLTIWSVGRQAFDVITPQPDYVYINDFKVWGMHANAIFFYQLSRVVFNRVTVRGDLSRYGTYETYSTAGCTASDYVAADVVLLDWDVQGTVVGIEVPDLRANDCNTPVGCPVAGQVDQPQIVIKGGYLAAVTCVEVSSNWDKNGFAHLKGDQRAIIDSVAMVPSGSCYNCPPAAEIMFQSTCTDSTNLLTRDELIVLNHQGVSGDNFQVWTPEQDPDYVWARWINASCCTDVPSCNARPILSTPQLGLTNQQIFSQYGIMRHGEFAPCNGTRAGIQGSRNLATLLWEPAIVCPVRASGVRSFNGNPPPLTTVSTISGSGGQTLSSTASAVAAASSTTTGSSEQVNLAAGTRCGLATFLIGVLSLLV